LSAAKKKTGGTGSAEEDCQRIPFSPSVMKFHTELFSPNAETHNKKVLFIRMVFDLFICIALRISDLGLKYSNFVIILTNND